MNKIAVISDIHSNINALKAVFNEIEKRGIYTVLCSGDIIGYHVNANEVIDFIQEKGVISIAGNHDRDVVTKQFDENSNELNIFKFTYNILNRKNREWLESLPTTKEIELFNKKINITHGSPDDVEEYLFENKPNSLDYIEKSDAHILISGHTHLPWSKTINGTHFVNSGSVGKPKVGRPIATFSIISISNDDISSETIYIDYNYEEVAQEVESYGFKKYADALRRGKA